MLFTPEKCEHEETGMIFSFQYEDSTAYSYHRPYCKKCSEKLQYNNFKGTPKDQSYLALLVEHSDGSEIVPGEYYTVTAQVDWIDENGNVLKYGTAKTFYIPVQPKVNRYQVAAYNCTGDVQAYDGMGGSSGAVYYGQRIYVKYQYTCDTTWTSYNNLYGTGLLYRLDDCSNRRRQLCVLLRR